MSDLTGLRIAVTGGASGMGAAVVHGFPRLGAAVVSLDRAVEAGQRVAAEGGAAFVECDVADERSVEAAFSAAAEQLGGLDVLVHAAGVAARAPAAEQNVDEWHRVMATNAGGTFLTNRAAYPHLKENRGAILNFASAAGVRGAAGWGAYAASKGAVVAWTRTIALEWGPDGIRANCIAPAMRTPMFDGTRSTMTIEQLAAWDEQLRATIPLGGRLGDPEQDLVPVLAFLSCSDSGYITGQTISIDGGMLMVR